MDLRKKRTWRFQQILTFTALRLKINCPHHRFNRSKKIEIVLKSKVKILFPELVPSSQKNSIFLPLLVVEKLFWTYFCSDIVSSWAAKATVVVQRYKHASWQRGHGFESRWVLGFSLLYHISSASLIRSLTEVQHNWFSYKICLAVQLEAKQD